MLSLRTENADFVTVRNRSAVHSIVVSTSFVQLTDNSIQDSKFFPVLCSYVVLEEIQKQM